MSLRKRLQMLEARQVAGQRSYEVPAYLTLYLKELENIQREEAGLDPIPLTPEEEALSAAGEEWFAEEYIPHLRELGGSPETLAIIEELEEHAREEMTDD